MMAEPKYWVYEHAVVNKAVIHISSCSYCNDGQGTKDHKKLAVNKWLGPYNTYQEARQVAEATGRPSWFCRTKGLDNCAPHWVSIGLNR